MIAPIWLLKYLPNMLRHISILIDCQGPSNTITEADAATYLAIGEAAGSSPRQGRRHDRGGADSKIHPLSLVRLALHHNMSHWRGNALAGRLICGDRTVPGEGAGILILEVARACLARGRDSWRSRPARSRGVRHARRILKEAARRSQSPRPCVRPVSIHRESVT